jgi:hypothetical protein
MKRTVSLLLLTLMMCLAPAFADSIDFEDLSDSTAIDSNYASLGVVFQNATILTAGLSLNELEFPPSSGVNVAFDATGPVTLTFTTPVTSFTAIFTYAQSLALTGFDSLDNPVATTGSLFDSNFTSSGNPTNELIAVNFGGGISTITIVGNAFGGSFTFDDVSFTPAQVVSVPEPDMISLLSLSIICLVVCVYSRRRTVVRCV